MLFRCKFINNIPQMYILHWDDFNTGTVFLFTT